MKPLRILFVAILLGMAFYLGRRSAAPQVEIVETRVDTVFFYRPHPIRTSDLAVSINVPKWLFAKSSDTGCLCTQYNKGDGAAIVPSADMGDSIRMQVVARTLEYRDSTYYARVVGPAVGSLAPRLDFIETYNTTTVQTQIISKRPAWDIGIEVGVDLRNRWAGVYATRSFGRMSLSALAGYDPFRREPRLEIRSAVSIWQPKTKK